MQYGTFDDSRREYIITNPKTPVRWINYIGTLQFGGFVDQIGGALLCAGDPSLNRITKYLPQMPAVMPQGECLFVRVRTESLSAYEIICPFFVPSLNPYSHYSCHVGLGYQKIVSRINGIETQVLIFIPPDAPVELRSIHIKNLRSETVEVDIIPYVEYSHFDALKQFTNADWVPQTMVSKALRDADGHLVLHQYAFMKRGLAHNFMAADCPIDSFESARSHFLGNQEFAALHQAQALKAETFSNYEALRGDNIGALLIKKGALQPGESCRTIIQLGQAHPNRITTIASRFRDPQQVDAAFLDLNGFWETYLSQFHCETPDMAFNSMVNVHNPRQCYITMNWSRYLSLYQLGLGARGIGFRDSSQDSMGAVMGAPGEVKSLLGKILSVQKSDGSAMHQFYPLTMEANEGDAREEDGKKTYGDDHLWGILATTAYLKESGDLSFLDTPVSFYDKRLAAEEREQAPVLEHLERALRYSKEHVGAHGIPLLGFADWNDTVNLKGDAESAFNAHLYGKCLLEMIDLMEHLQLPKRAAELRDDYAEMKKRFNACAWDGEWFIRYWEENGSPLGSKSNPHASIFANAQSWAVISGFASPEKGRIALDAVHRLLNTPNGIKLSTPGYDGYDSAIGGVTTYPPGAKENGGIFLHANPWVMIAECLLGNGDRAFQYYHQINPAAKNGDIETYEVEPYVYAQNILGDEHPQFGLGRNSWLSGTASWMFQAAVQHILGIQPVYDGLRLAPCLPASWDGYKAHRRFRGASYTITVRVVKNAKAQDAFPRLTVNGQHCSGNVVPLAPSGSNNDILLECPGSTTAIPLLIPAAAVFGS